MPIFDTLNTILTGALGPFGPIIAVGVLGLGIIAVAILLMLKERYDPMTKLANAGREGAVAKKEESKKEALRRASPNE